MSRSKTKVMDRVLSILLAVIMVVGMIPVTALAATTSRLSTDIDQKLFNVGQATEFTFTTTANDDAGTMVLGSFEFSDPSAIEKLEYKESKDGNWYEFKGDFGPSTGFTMSDATSKFRVTFNKAGTYSVIFSIKKVDGGNVLCSVTKDVMVIKTASTLTTDIGEQSFTVGQATEFSFTMTANDSKGIMVLGSFEFSDQGAIEKLEYKESKDGKWYEFNGDFGPSTGFPMSDATSQFRVTFNKSGNYSVNASMKRADNGTVLCSSGTISLSVIAEYDVTVTANNGGTVKLDGKDVSSITVVENTNVPLSVVADKSYQIASVSIGGVEQTIEDKTSFNKNITVTADTVVAVSFVKVYTITVSHTGEGTVVTNPECDGGVVVVNTGTNVTVSGTPKENYRVSEVTVNGVKDNTVKGENNEKYDDEFVANADREYVITFAPNRYNVTVADYANGSVVIDNAVVEHGKSTTVRITPDAGYSVESVEINGAKVDELLDDGAYTIENITSDQLVKVEFKIAAMASIDDVTFNFEDALRSNSSGTLYVYAKDSSAVFSTTKNAIKITYTDNSTAGGYFSKNVTISSTKTIKKIELSYKANGEIIRSWHTVPTITENKTLKIVIDNTIPTADLISADANENGYYNNNVNVAVEAKDTNDYSGIKSVEYWVACDGTETQRGVLYSHINGEEIKDVYNGNILVDATKNNSDNVVVNLKVIDRAGNENSTSCSLKINTTKPTVSVSIGGEIASGTTDGYYNTTRKAVITYIDRATSFDKTAALNGIVITAVDAKGETVSVSKPSMISWSESGDTHQATINFDTDAHYTWSVKYTNKAGLASDGILSEIGKSIYDFTVDKKAPKGAITFESDTWDSIISTLTFGIWKNYSLTATATATDTTSDMYDVVYLKSNADTVMSEDELNSAYAEGQFKAEEITVNSDEKFVVYARFMDYAGNYAYVSTNGIIYDKTAGEITLTLDKANDNGYYNKDVNVDISVNENVNEVLAYSGIKSIDYTVKNGETVTQSGNLYTFDVENPTYDKLRSDWAGNITVDSTKNNSDNITVTVTVIDNAGNEYKEDITLSINIDRPTAEVKFVDVPVNTVEEHGYFNASRVATLTVKDRAKTFDEDAAISGIVINAVDAKGEAVEAPYLLGKWSHDGDKHSVQITFAKDGNYTWSFSYTNKADKALEVDKIVTGDSKSPYSFTVDTTNPTGTVKVATNVWDRLLNVLTFGLYSNVKVDVTATADDATSPYDVEYYKTNDEVEILLGNELDQKTFKPFEDFSIESDEQFVVYLKVTDRAGNYTYISSDGFVVDMTESNITLTPDKANANNTYNKDINVAVKVEDIAPYSGIKTVDYVVVKDNDSEHPTQSANLYTFEVDNPSHKDLKNLWEGSILVDANLNNSSSVVVIVTVKDNAGNVSTKSVALDIDITAPTIEVAYNNNKDNNGNAYFADDRIATVTITERTNHFDTADATKGIEITAKDAKGNAVKDAYTISSWETVEGNTPDAATHTATIHYAADANYTFAISCTDKADNANKSVDTKDSIAPFKFTVDTTNPFGSVTAKSAEGRETKWDALANELTFGFWSKQKITLKGTSDDKTSPIASVEYYKVTAKNATDGTTTLKKENLDKITEWKAFTGFEVAANEQFTVYIKITDNAGNYTYISTDGLIVDDQAPIEETIAPEITVKPEQPLNGFYSSDVEVDIAVKDPLVGGTYSGLKTVSYKVFNMGVETQSGTLYSFNIDNPKQDDLLQSWTGKITVDSKLNNSNDVVIEVYAEDNSLNSSKDKAAIKIDITAPTIDVSYDNNNVDSGKYFKDNRTATIVVTERNFNADDVKVNITNTDGVIPNLSDWKKSTGTGNMDDTTWTATVTYRADGDYTFDISYTDVAGSKCKGAQYGDSVAPKAFTVDKTTPVIKVAYDNNSALNSNYYKDARTATVVIAEHNFSTERIKIALSATDDGKATTVPTVKGWTTNGDVHTATIAYTGDALYNFDIEYSDLAGNSAADFDKQTFYVDKTAPSLEISGVADKSANSGDVIPVVTYSDTNFDVDKVTITLVGTNRKSVTLDGTRSDIHNGQTFTFKDFAKEQKIDDIYTLTAKVTDKAGNSTEKVITFSVNRFGSTYALSDSAKDLNGSYVQTPVDVVITETNANELKNIKITLFKNNETIVLKEGVDYKIDVTGGNGQWYHYTYTVFKKNFEDDGVYRLTIHSEDAAGNVAENTLDTKDTKISFGVDKTNPNIVVANLESGTTYALDNLKVTMSANDNLLLSTVIVYLDDYNKAYKTWSAEEIAEIIATNGEFTFDISGDSTSAHKVEIVCVDAAGNKQVEEIEDFFVTTNLWVRYYTNKPLFFGSIAGVIVLAGLIVFLVVYKKKKNEDK